MSNGISDTTPAERRLFGLLRQGARILLDLRNRRAVLLDTSSGWRPFMDLTLRMVSSMIRKGWLFVEGRCGDLVYYAAAA